ncbi:prolyl oligopeptidase family serine peptidase [Rudanella paleaurantiibacter]|uniref:Prolyl oligopeptidase family serine peptidase n=1 Tax=Rudanella paleaurantiibacter TaxID=2614655 RepID=A0A7J5TTV4_9BACT|nr:prolyl oligopeptidase family serine peptidase [Rudanella paleaurantiibacter]KAB7727291.1 prolyl oligopeptidase family serine peptidase [Rudanella paleaurantiibacter]
MNATRLLHMLVLLSISTVTALAQETGYRLPPNEIGRVINATAAPTLRFHPISRRTLLITNEASPSIHEMAQPELRLAGLRINPRNNSPSRQLYMIGLATGQLPTTPAKAKETATRPILGLPDGARLSELRWSPDGHRIAFLRHTATKIELWTADLRTAQARQLGQLTVNAVTGNSFDWLSASERLLVKTVPANRLPLPQPDAQVSGPLVQHNEGSRKAGRTYQDLLRTPADEQTLAHYLHSQLTVVDLSGRAQPCGQPDLITQFSASPNSQYVLVKSLRQPFSYTLPYSRFANKTVVLNRATGQVAYEVANLPIADQIPPARDAVATGPRQIDWRSDQPATLYWVEAQDGGDPKQKAAVRDRLMTHSAPFTGPARELTRSAYRISGVYWGNDSTALIADRWWASRQRIWRRIRPNAPDRTDTLFAFSTEDRQANPGDPELTRNAQGKLCLDLTRTNQLVFSGTRVERGEEVSFAELVNVNTRARKPLWASQTDFAEASEGMIDSDNLWMLVSRETPDTPTNYWCRHLPTQTEYQLTHFPNPYPHFTNLERIPLRYQRADGLTLTADLWVSSEHKGKRLPALLWAYPTEYLQKQFAGQTAKSSNRFKAYSELPTLWALRGYAVLTNVSFPIVADSGRNANDTYLEQLLLNARAALQAAHVSGQVDTARVAVMGQSYGAFMVANLLTNSNLFKAGIALSGAYNRSLTPFGFQSEERTLWDAPELYNRLSPFLYADRVEAPLLLVHGQADNNPGTHYMQSERYFAALQGLGKTARFVTLPHESHAYVATESLLHLCYEIDQWLNRYLPREVAHK